MQESRKRFQLRLPGHTDGVEYETACALLTLLEDTKLCDVPVSAVVGIHAFTRNLSRELKVYEAGEPDLK